jgi:TRAP-type mannitol/chloroaromatic compound transport system permease large subunit
MAYLRLALGLAGGALIAFLALSDPAQAAWTEPGVMGFIKANMAPIMFASLILFMLVGYPVSFALAANGLIFGLIGIWMGLFPTNFMQALPDRVFAIMTNEVLLAIPFFTFMGLILERSRMAEDLLDTMGQLFGPIRGGLAYAVIFVGALMAATTGVVAAAIISMGLISLPIMLRYGYDQRIATGVIMASGTLAQIIPPSLVLIVMSDVLGVSVGDMYAGAIIPGLVLSALFAIFILLVSIFKPAMVPALPIEARTLGGGVTSLIVVLAIAFGAGYLATMWATPRMEQAPEVFGAAVGVVTMYLIALANKMLNLNLLSRLATQVVMVLVPPLALIFLVLGTIFIGLATPTEGGAMGALGALVLAAINRRLDFMTVKSAAEGTLKLAAFVMFILIGARVFALTFYGVDGNIWVKELLLSLPGGQVGFLIFVSIIIFALGFFIDFFEIAFILLPLLVAPAQVLGIDLVFLGVLIGVNLQTSFLTPPFGFALFYLRSVAPKDDYIDKVTGKLMKAVQTTTIYKGAAPFICIQVLMIGLTWAFPQMVMVYKDDVVQVDPAAVQQKLDNIQIPGLDFNSPLGLPALDLPPPPRP